MLIHKMVTGILLLFCWTLSLATLNLPYFPIIFPRDHAAHYKNIPYTYRHLIEWWYFNGQAITDDGKSLSYDVAVFLPALNHADNHRAVITLPILHIQVADLDKKQAYGTSHFYPFLAGNISTNVLDIIINDDFTLREDTQNGKQVFILKAADKNKDSALQLDLVLEPISQPFLINENGLLPMPNNTNTYYYTIPRFKTTGSISINKNIYKINNRPGESWMDHEWGDFLVNDFGWEWFSIRLDNGLIANIFLSVEFKTKSIVGGLANLILPTGEKRYIPYKNFIVTRDNYWHDAKLDTNFPMTFNFNFPELNLELKNVASFPEQEFHGYWEGYCFVDGVYNKAKVKGYSYTEIVYNNPTKPTDAAGLRV